MDVRVAYGRRQLLLKLLSGGVVCFIFSPKTSRAWVQARRRGGRHRRIVMIDPGHGGQDPGAIGIAGTAEKIVTLDTARAIAWQLQSSGRYRVLMTRDSDVFVALRDRVSMAQTERAELFVSVHADANPNHHIHGASVYTLSEKASDREAAQLAARENSSDRVAGIDLSKHEPIVNEILYDLARRQTNNLSLRFAQALVAELGRDVTLMDNTHRSAGFVVLKAPDIPSALVELGCLSNAREERKLDQVGYQARLAGSVARSIDNYFLDG